MNPVIIAKILDKCGKLEKFLREYFDHLRTRVLKHGTAGEWRSMVKTLISVAKKLCEGQGQRTVLRECFFDLTNLTFIFRSEENERWDRGTFVLFLLKVPHIDPQIAFILMTLIQWVVEYPDLVSCFRRCFREPKPYCDLNHSYQDGQEVLIHNTGNFVNFLIGTNDNFQQVLPAPIAIRKSFFGTRLKLCRMDVPLFLVVSSRKRRKMMVISGMSLKVLQKFFQDRLCNYGFRLMLPDFVTKIKKN